MKSWPHARACLFAHDLTARYLALTEPEIFLRVGLPADFTCQGLAARPLTSTDGKQTKKIFGGMSGSGRANCYSGFR